MTVRVYFKPKDCHSVVPFQRLGDTGKGAWGLVEDRIWIARPDAMELLYFTEAEYAHAMRRLSPKQIALAIERRRKMFWKPIGTLALGEMQMAMWKCMLRADNDARGLRLRAGLLALHAKLAYMDGMIGQPTQYNLEYLFRRDSEIIEDLSCSSIQRVYPVDQDGKERELHRRFLDDLIRLRWKRSMGPGDKLFLQIRRGFAVKPISQELRMLARVTETISVEWRDMLLMGLTERDVESFRGDSERRLWLICGRIGKLLGMARELTEDQLGVEISDRLDAPDLYDHFLSYRIGTASTREALRLLTLTNKKVNEVLTRQLEEEIHGLGVFRKHPPAKPTLDDLLSEMLARFDVLDAITVRRKSLRTAAQIRKLVRDIGKLLEGDR
jgi:hypothetical protein